MAQQQMNMPPQGAAQAYEKHGSSGGVPNSWTFGLFDCCSPFGTCCLSCWCPCIAFGRTHAREQGEVDPSGINGMCCAFYCLMHLGAHSCLQCITRGNTRSRYTIEGNAFGDFCASLCCPCCVLVQEEKESIVRTTGINPKTNQPYNSPNAMTYP